MAIGGRTLLHPLDLHLPDGGVCGLIGQNGSGKTTLLRVLARQLSPSRGTVRFAGRTLDGWGRRAFAKQVSYMPQNPPVDLSLSVQELVSVGRFPWHGTLGRVTEADRTAVRTAMRHTGVDALAGRALGSLSGGERQRAVIALCVAQGGRCLLLDEPTSALDVAHQVQVLQVLRALSREHGIGVVLVLHDINLAGRFCDTLLALRGGRLIAAGPPDAVMRESVLEEVYGTRLGIVPHPGGHGAIAYVP